MVSWANLLSRISLTVMHNFSSNDALRHFKPQSTRKHRESDLQLRYAAARGGPRNARRQGSRITRWTPGRGCCYTHRDEWRSSRITPEDPRWPPQTAPSALRFSDVLPHQATASLAPLRTASVKTSPTGNISLYAYPGLGDKEIQRAVLRNKDNTETLLIFCEI